MLHLEKLWDTLLLTLETTSSAHMLHLEKLWDTLLLTLETTSSAHSVKLNKPVLAVLLTHADDEQLRHSSITNMWASIKQVIVISSIITRHSNTVRIMNGGLHADRLDNFFDIAACSSSCVLPCWGFMLSYKCISSSFEDNDGSS